MCFTWTSEQTAIIPLYGISVAVFRTEAECLLRGTNWVFKSDSFILREGKHNKTGKKLWHERDKETKSVEGQKASKEALLDQFQKALPGLSTHLTCNAMPWHNK